ncbi:hypothetical protein PUN28_003904 [Cardiocondyla obscurior]|uniref:C2H2-type domain-containing protein n=1 Tax=Cardiocondyla obscurior TaxID=286306 RepID=A0AAW2GKT6_9HYME
MSKTRAGNVQTNARSVRIPAGVTLRDCSIVIVGSTCKICGRDFKCESDVALHTRWRHNALGPLIDALDQEINPYGQKCDVCEMRFEVSSNLKAHKRLIHKQKIRRGRRIPKETVRVRFKLNGVTTTDVCLDRRYIELEQNSVGYIVDVCTQAPAPLENDRPERKDDCAGNIDWPFPNRVADKSHMQRDIQPDKAANRYIVSKFASTKGDTIGSRTIVVGKSLMEISNTTHKNAIPDSGSPCEEYKKHYLTSLDVTPDVYIKTLSSNVSSRDKENSQRPNERERRSAHHQNEIPFDDKGFLACQSEKFDKASVMFKENSRSSESSQYSIRWSNEVMGAKETAGLASSFIDSMKIIINNEKNYGFDKDAGRRLSPAAPRFHRKPESKTSSNVDDDVQEVLRITRENAQNDINHESPNRVEREMLVQNATTDTFTLPPSLQPSVCPEKCDVTFTNFEPSNYSPLVSVSESDYQFLANSFDKKLGIYLEDLHHYGIRLYNDLPEINNNLEDYAVYAPQDLFETWKQSDESPYTNGLRTNDNEISIVLD